MKYKNFLTMVIFGQARHFPSLGRPRETRETNFILSKNSESINPRRNLYQENALLTNYFRKMNKRTVSRLNSHKSSAPENLFS